jgi:hypothetical protein
VSPFRSVEAIALLAAPAPGYDAETLADRLATLGVAGQVGIRLPLRLAKPNPDGSGELALRPSPHAAILLVAGLAGETLPALATAMRASGVSVDLKQSALVVGRLHEARPGDGTVLVTMLASRRRDLTREAFSQRWLGGHASFGLRADAAAYRQLHAEGTPALDPHLPAANRYDGVGMVWFRDLDHVARARASPEIARDATVDEMEFIDHGRSMLMMFRMRSAAVAAISAA